MKYSIGKTEEFTVALDSQAITDTVLGNAIKVCDLIKLSLLVQSGVITDGAFTVKIFECDTENGTYTELDSANYSGELAFADTEDNVAKKIDVYHSKDYVKLQITETGTSTGGIFSALAVAHPKVEEAS